MTAVSCWGGACRRRRGRGRGDGRPACASAMASEEAGERGAHWEEWGSGRPTCARGACTLVGPRAAPAAAGWSVLFQEWSNAGGVVACSACPRRSRPVNATSVGSAVCHRLPDGDRIPYQSVLFALFSLCSRPALLGRETLALHPLSPTPAPTCSLPPAPECSHSRSSWPRSSSSSPPPPLTMVSDQPPGRPSQASRAQSATQRRRYHHRRAPGSPQTAS